MPDATPDEATRRCEEGLKKLVLKGWKFQSLPDSHLGHYEHPNSGVVDSLTMRDFDDCIAWRTREQGNMVWNYEGDVFTCIKKLLELPAPEESSAPTSTIGHSPILWTP